MSFPLKKHPGIIITAIVIALLLAWGFQPKEVQVETIQPKQAPLTVSIQEDGRTRIIDRYPISAPVNGMTCRMHLKVGTEVKQDEILLEIRPLPSAILDSRSRAQAQQSVSAAQASLQAAKQQQAALQATALQAELEVKRFQPMLSKGLISKDVFDKAQTQSQAANANLKTAEYQVKVAEHELEAAQVMLKYSSGETGSEQLELVKVKSPIDGRILKVNRQCDGPVSVGESMLEIGDPKQLEIEVDVLSADAVKIKPGMKVLFDRWGGDKPLEGEVRLIEPVGFTKVSALGVEEQRVWVIADFTSAPELWQSLGDAYRVEAEFVLWHEEEVLQIPSSAAFRYQGGWAVFTDENGTAKRKTIEIGKRNGLQIQVLSGLSETDSVINNPNETVEDGVKINSGK